MVAQETGVAIILEHGRVWGGTRKLLQLLKRHRSLPYSHLASYFDHQVKAENSKTDWGYVCVKLWTPFCSVKCVLCQCLYILLWTSLKNVTPCWTAHLFVDYSIHVTIEANKSSDMKNSFLQEQMYFTGFCLWICLPTTAKEEADGKA